MMIRFQEIRKEGFSIITYSKGCRETSFHPFVSSSIRSVIHLSRHGMFTSTRQRKSGIQTWCGKESNRKRWHTCQSPVIISSCSYGFFLALEKVTHHHRSTKVIFNREIVCLAPSFIPLETLFSLSPPFKAPLR